MTREQAIAQAVRFYTLCLQKTGRKPAKFEVISAQQESLSTGELQPYWQVIGTDSTEIHIQDKDGLPTGIYFLPSDNPQSKGLLRSERVLEVHARNYQRLFFSKAGQFTESPRISRFPHQLTFFWTRMHRSVPFHHQECAIGVSSGAGELMIAALNAWTDLPTNEIGKIMEREAQKLALQQARDVYKGTLRITKSERRIVEGNRFWIDRSARRLSDTRFAWLVTVQATQEDGSWVSVGVDSQTGEPIYGEIQQLRG